MRAKFEVHTVFTAGRSMMIMGWVIEGQFKAGGSLSVPGFPRRIIIAEVRQFRAEQAGLRPGIIGLLISVSDEWEQARLKELAAPGQVFQIDSGINIPEGYALAAIVAVSFGNAAIVLRLPEFEAIFAGFVLGILEMYIIRFLSERQLTYAALAMVLNAGLGSLAILGYCAVQTHVLCDRNPIVLSFMPAMMMASLTATDAILWAFARLRKREG